MIKDHREIIVVAHDMRSIHNVGSLLRTAEGLGITELVFSGYTPHPAFEGDTRLPHVALRQTNQIHKTALGAESMVMWRYAADIKAVIEQYKDNGYEVIALEQTNDAVPLPDYHVPEKLVIVLGREVEGLEDDIIEACSSTVVIPMFGSKESFNVVEAATMAMYHARFSLK